MNNLGNKHIWLLAIENTIIASSVSGKDYTVTLPEHVIDKATPEILGDITTLVNGWALTVLKETKEFGVSKDTE